MTIKPTLYLASQSPRRRELLQQIEISFEILSIDVPEEQIPAESPHDYVTRVAKAKATAGWQADARRLDIPVLGADTAVIIDGHILGKPKDEQDAIHILKSLSGREHQVLSCIALALADKIQTVISITNVKFRKLDEAEIAAYIATNEPFDKAGAYAIQGKAAAFIEKIEGSYSGVVGLPLFELQQLLKGFLSA